MGPLAGAQSVVMGVLPGLGHKDPSSKGGRLRGTASAHANFSWFIRE